MNERERMDVLKCVTVTLVLVQISPVLCTTHSWWSPNHTANFSAVRPAVPEIRKSGISARAHGAPTAVPPPSTVVKRLTNGSRTTYQISPLSIQPFPRYGKGAHLHVRKGKCTASMTCAICIATWSLTTHQIWSLSAEPFLSYSLAANGHPSRRTRYLPG